MQSPPSPFIIGSATLTIAAIATAASAALPPALRMSLPTTAASGWLEQAMPFFANTGARSGLNGRMVRVTSAIGSNGGLFRDQDVLAREPRPNADNTKILPPRRLYAPRRIGAARGVGSGLLTPAMFRNSDPSSVVRGAACGTKRDIETLRFLSVISGDGECPANHANLCPRRP